MTLDEFLRWEDGTDTRYELVGGSVRALKLSTQAHAMLRTRLAIWIDATLAQRRPCSAQFSAGVVPPGSIDTFFVVDIAASCAPIGPQRQAIEEPFLIVEILPPSTECHDRRIKLLAYRQIETMQEILLIASEGMYAELHRRSGAQWITEIRRGAAAVLDLASVGLVIRLGELYEGIALPEDEE